MDKQFQLEALFREHSIDCTTLEFYNNPEFVAAETKAPEFLWEYADYFRTRNYPDNYVKKASESIPKIVQFLFDALVADGRLGACPDISLATSKILEKYGFWNSIQTGSLTAELPNACTRQIRH